jgi:uncharacterized tellurite resistance protein B-like protein
MGILSLLGLAPKPAQASSSSDVDTVRRIGEALEKLPADRARFVGTFALCLARVANADLSITEAETRRMEQLVAEHAGLDAAQAALAVEIAKVQHRLFGGTEDYLASRELRKLSSLEERMRLLDCLFAVSAADDDVSGVEENVIRQIATELGIDHAGFIEARRKVGDKRSVLKE